MGFWWIVIVAVLWGVLDNGTPSKTASSNEPGSTVVCTLPNGDETPCNP